MRTTTSRGTPATSSASSSAVRIVPVGLLGVQAMTTRVRGVMAASMAGTSWRASGVSGTRTARAPATATQIGYASKDRQGMTTSSPGSQTASSRCWMRATEPLPTTT